MDLFLLKKIIGTLLMPINVILLLLIFALIVYKSRPSLSFKMFASATCLLFLSSFPPVADHLMTSIENDYEPFSLSSEPIDYIVILGCGHTTNYALPTTSQLKTCSLQRLVEAVRIYKLHPEARIITSGYSGSDPVPNALVVKQAAILLGIPEHKIITESFPKDTEEEAELIAPRVKGTTVVLVTNADHMPRSINYFKAHGVDPIPAPAGYWVKNVNSKKTWADFTPQSHKLQQTTIAWYETLGRIVQWFKALFT